MAWVLCNQVNIFYGFHKSFIQHYAIQRKTQKLKQVLYIITKHTQTYIKQTSKITLFPRVHWYKI